MMVIERHRQTKISAVVDGQEQVKAHQPYHTSATDKWFIPTRVEITTLVGGDDWSDPLHVKVSGDGILKSGKPGQITFHAEYSTRGGQQYVSSLPLGDMPAWLAEFVATATAGLLADTEVSS